MLPAGWIEPIGGLLTALLGYLYKGALDRIRELREDHEKQIFKVAEDVKAARQEMMVFTAAMASNQTKVHYLEKQSDEIFAVLREIQNSISVGLKELREEVRGKQDKRT
jgi:arginine deiminase